MTDLIQCPWNRLPWRIPQQYRVGMISPSQWTVLLGSMICHWILSFLIQISRFYRQRLLVLLWLNPSMPSEVQSRKLFRHQGNACHLPLLFRKIFHHLIQNLLLLLRNLRQQDPILFHPQTRFDWMCLKSDSSSSCTEYHIRLRLNTSSFLECSVALCRPHPILSCTPSCRKAQFLQCHRKALAWIPLTSQKHWRRTHPTCFWDGNLKSLF